MPARARTKSPQVKFSPVDLIANEALTRISARTKPVDLQPDNPIQWIEDHFRIPREEREDMRIILYPYHKVALSHALSRDERGLFRYSLVLWSDIKKSIKCLHPLTSVLMSDGSLKSAEDIIAGNSVLSWREGSYYANVVTQVAIQPASPMYRIETNRGRVIIVTGEHPVSVEGMRGRYPSYKSINKLAKEVKWVKASALAVGDRITVGLDWMAVKACPNPDEMYTLGVYIGDGGEGKIINMDEEVIDRVRKFIPLNKIGHSKYQYYMTGGGAFTRKYKLWKTNSRTKQVPSEVFTAGREGVAQFLSGYFDTDGHISKLTRKQPMANIGSVNRGLLKACQHLLSGLGINAVLRKHYTIYKGLRIDVWYLVVQGKEPILKLSNILTLSCKHKRERLAAWAQKIENSIEHKSDVFSTDRIVKIDILPSEESIAIEVSGDHNHITNGLVTHNSTIAAAVLLWRAWHTDYGQFYVIANTKDQADSRVAYYLRRAIELNPELKRQCNVNYSTHTVTLPNRSFIKAIPVNAAGEAGANPTMVEITELWGATSKEAQRMWTETTLPPALLGKAQRWIDTYAGFEGESVILEQLYDMGVTQGVKVDPEYDFMYENKPARMFTMWNQVPRLPWQSDEYYASEERTLLPAEFMRVHRNQWSSASEAFVPKEWIDACRGDIPPYHREPCIGIVDGALKDDSFGLLLLSKVGDKVYERYSRAWYPPLGGQIDFEGTPESPGPELEMRRLNREFVVIEWAYDQTHVADMMSRLNKKHGFHIHDFSQGELRLVADKMLRDMIRDRNFVHSGSPDLVAHLSNANAKIPPEGREYLRIVKRNQRQKIDLAVCASMGTYELKVAYNIT